MASIEVAQRAMGFQTSTERTRCGNCRNCEQREFRGSPGFRCKVGGFMVSANAICQKYEADRRREPEVVTP